MDINYAASLFIAKVCARAATDASTLGPGELAITDSYGTVLTDSTALKSVPYIQIHARSFNGVGGINILLKGTDIKGYTHRKYVAPVPQATLVNITEFNKTNFTYSLYITTDRELCRSLNRKTVSVTVGATAKTKVQLVDAFVEKINQNNLYKDRLRTWELEQRILQQETILEKIQQ